MKIFACQLFIALPMDHRTPVDFRDL